MEEKERQHIVDLLRDHDGNRNKVAGLVGRHASTVGRIAKEAGIESKSRNIAATKKANEARSAYAEERRLELIGKGFKKADELLKEIVSAGEFQKWTVGLGTLVDKARLETGEVTDRSERHNHNHRSLESYFAELDRYREVHGELGTTEQVDTPGADS